MKITEYTDDGAKEITRPSNDIITYKGNLTQEIETINKLKDIYNGDKKTDIFMRDMCAIAIENGYEVKSRTTGKVLLKKEWV